MTRMERLYGQDSQKGFRLPNLRCEIENISQSVSLALIFF